MSQILNRSRVRRCKTELQGRNQPGREPETEDWDCLEEETKVVTLPGKLHLCLCHCSCHELNIKHVGLWPTKESNGFLLTQFSCLDFIFSFSQRAVELFHFILKIELEVEITLAVTLLFPVIPISDGECCSLFLCSFFLFFLSPLLDLQSSHVKEHVAFYVLKTNAEVLEILS